MIKSLFKVRKSPKISQFCFSEKIQKEALYRNVQYKIALKAILEGSNLPQNILYSDARRV